MCVCVRLAVCVAVAGLVVIATGWSPVDSEPLIPQTALMGLSKKHAFDGVNDRVDLGSDKPNNGTGATYTINQYSLDG